MDIDQLIETLARDVAPVPRHAVARRLCIGLGLGAVATLLCVALVLGLRPDLGLAIHRYAVWIKGGYTLSLGLCAAATTAHVARPDARRAGWLWLTALPVVSLAAVAVFEMSQVAQADWLAMWLGQSWKVCSALVFLLSLPIFGGLLWSFRSLAPTRLRLAGASAGLTAGAWAATLYCLHCPEVSAIFVLTWYTLGMVLAAVAGAILGPRLMRW